MSLNREAIIGAVDLKTEEVEVPEWGGSVNVRGFTAAEFDSLSGIMRSMGHGSTPPSNMRARVCALCMIDEKGNRLFTDEDIEVLGRKSTQALQRVFDVAQRLSGVGQAKELAGN